MNLTGSKWVNLIIIPVTIILITGLNYYNKNTQVEDVINNDWSTSTPETENMNPVLLDEMMEVISKESIPIDSVIVVRNGCIVKEEYPSSKGQDTKRKLWSTTKSITSALIGIAIQEGYIEGVDQKVLDYFPEITVTEQDRKKEITIKHLLTMTPGYQWDKSFHGSGMRASVNPVQYVLDSPMVHNPGAVYNYGDGAPFLLGAILSKATGLSTLEFATKYLFEPLNITEIYWENNGDEYFTASGLHLLPRDMAKIGCLFLNEGKWGNEQIISPEWIEESTQTHFSGPGFMAGEDYYIDGYGYLWWINPDSGVYYASGMFEQRIYICPELELVVVFTAHNVGNDVTPRLLFKYILPSCIEYTPNRYDKYGVSFSYPRGMNVGEAPSPFAEGDISEDSGFVQVSYSYPYESFSVMWYAKNEGTDQTTEIERLFSMIESDTNVIERGAVYSMEVNGRSILYMSANVTEDGYQTSGMIGCWFSYNDEKTILSYYIADPNDFTQKEIKNNFLDYINSVQHE
jgi:CubicO group peptidase (beta-lactamase class C family)